MAAAETLRIEVVYCPAPGQVDQVQLQMPPGASLADAVQASGLLQRHALQFGQLHAGIWSKSRPPETLLRDQDRVELYRALTVDPKEARRLRYNGSKRSKDAKDAKATKATKASGALNTPKGPAAVPDTKLP